MLEHSFYSLIITSLGSYQVFYFGRQTFFFSVLCAIMKSVDGLVYLLEPYSLWELVISFCDIWFTLLKWDKSLSVCVFIYPICSLVFSLFTCWTLESILVLIWFFDVIWTILWCHTFFCALLAFLVFCPNCISFGSWKFCACLFTQYISYGMLYFLWSNI